mgnify:CR=1 FL=1
MVGMARRVLTTGLLAAVLLTACTQRGTPAAPQALSTAHASTTVRLALSWWQPHRDVTWQWQLSGTVEIGVSAQVFDIDMFTPPAATVRALHANGTKVLRYLDAGSKKPGRPDSAAFPSRVRAGRSSASRTSAGSTYAAPTSCCR